RRRELAERYDELLRPLAEVRPIGRVSYPSRHAWHLYVVRLDLPALTIDRNEFMSALHEENVGTGLHFPALHLSKWYREKYGYAPGSLPNAEAAGAAIFSLPLFPLLEESEQVEVVEALARVVASHRRSRA